MYVSLQVKVCEGCGMLWFREQNRGDVYCNKCVHKLADFPSPGSRKLRGRKSSQLRVDATTADASDGTLLLVRECE